MIPLNLNFGYLSIFHQNCFQHFNINSSFIVILYQKQDFPDMELYIYLEGMQPRGENVSKVKENQTEMALASIINLYV